MRVQGVVTMTESAIHDGTTLQLAPGIRAFVRAPNVVQFGSDATRTGMISTTAATEVASRINRLREARTYSTIVGLLAGPLGGPEAARSVVADLVSYRLLVPARRQCVLVLGNGALASQATRLLDEAGVHTRSAVRGESLTRFLLRQDSSHPVVAFDPSVLSPKLDPVLNQRKGPFVPVTQIDARVFVGPVCQPKKGPCPHCIRLYLLDRDPNWDLVTRSRPASAVPEALSAHAGAVAAALLAGRLAGVPDPPGVSAPPPGPGTTVVVDPYGPEQVRTTTLSPHSDCPVCF